MTMSIRTVLGLSVLISGLVAAPTLYAHDSDGRGMMRQPDTGNGSMMGGSGMMGMMGDNTTMTENCSAMMGRGGRTPNDQWQGSRGRQRSVVPDHRD